MTEVNEVHLFTSWRKIILEKLTIELINKFTTFYETLRFITMLIKSHVKWIHYQHGMAHPKYVDRGGLQICKVSVNLLNKQSQTLKKEAPFKLRGSAEG